MKRKLLALLLASVMVLSLVACGQKETPDTPETPDDQEEVKDYSGYTIRIYSNSNSTERTTWLIQEAKDAGFTISIDDNSVISGDTAAIQAANENKDGDILFGLNETRWSQVVDGVYENLKLVDWTPTWAGEVGEYAYPGAAYGLVIQNVLMLYRNDELGTNGEKLHFQHWADIVDCGYTWYRQNKVGGTTNANINSAMLYAFVDPSSPAGGISTEGWETLWKYCAEGKYSSDDTYKYGFDPLNKGDVAVSTFYSSSLYGKIDAAAESSEHPLKGAMTPENWDLVEIDDGTYYIAEYIGILDKAGRTEEETEAVKAFAEWFGLGRGVRLLSLQHRRGCFLLCRRHPRDLHPQEFRSDQGRRHRHDLCRVRCRALQRVDQHHDQPRLLLGRRLRRRGRARLGQPRLGDPDPEGRVRQAPRTASRGEAQRDTDCCVFSGEPGSLRLA